VSHHLQWRSLRTDLPYGICLDYTAQAVLKDMILQSNPNPHDRLAAICMSRLRDGGFRNSDVASREDLDAALASTPLLEYAYRSWSVHGRESIQDSDANSRLTAFVQECSAFPILPGPRTLLERFGPLHVVAYFDLPLSLVSPDQLRNPSHPSQKQRLTPLHFACMRNCRLVTKELLALPRILVNAQDKGGNTPLIWASQSDHANSVVDLLLSHPKIKVNESNKAGFTALHEAARIARVVKQLLAHPKIKINQGNNRGMTPFMLACATNDIGTLNLFLAHPKLKINATDTNGATALMEMMLSVADTVPLEIVEAVLAHPKLDVNRRDKGGYSASHWAFLSRRKELIDLFVNHPRTQRKYLE
jgi:ankyrin repeat domain-containing protein 50